MDLDLTEEVFSAWELFVDSLMGEGKVLVSREIELVSMPVSDELLIRLDGLHRNTMISGMPVLDTVTARWACKVFYVCCSLLAQRQLEIEELDAVMMLREDEALCEDLSSRMYSADLFFQLMPRLIEMLKVRSEQDVLIPEVEELVRNFPFSVPCLVIDFDRNAVNALLTDEAMRNTFVDRVIEVKAWHWLQYAEVRQRVEEVIGDHSVIFSELVMKVERFKVREI